MQQEKIVETKKCTHCGASFDITDKDLEFYEKVSPVFNGVKYNIPTPTLCPDCRQQRRLSFRNERKLYKRKCDATGKSIVSVYAPKEVLLGGSPDKKYPVYSSDEWWSDRWNPLDYGRDFDFTRPFFEQIKELMDEVPKLSIVNFNSQNSDYTNISADNKDCYLIVESSNNENSMYSYWLQLSRDMMDCAYANNSTLCYECTNIDNSYNLKYCNRCIDCKESFFLKDSEGCDNCFGCIGLQGKKFFIFNKESSETEYRDIVNRFLSGTKAEKESIRSQINEFFGTFGGRKPRIIMSENCSGDFILNSKNCISVIEANDAENCKYASDVWRQAKDAMDVNTFGRNAQIGYEALNCGIDVYNILFSALCWVGDKNISYSYYCTHSSNLFGCVGIHSPHSYCILNKQYTKEEYEALVPKIIEHMKSTGEWGEFFPSSLSPFGYNETVAMENHPLSRDVALQRLYNWSDYENPRPDVSKIILASKLPDDIAKIPDDILNWAIECEVTGKPFRIIKQELEFYRKHNLPIPRRHPDQRHLDRMKQKSI